MFSLASGLMVGEIALPSAPLFQPTLAAAAAPGATFAVAALAATRPPSVAAGGGGGAVILLVAPAGREVLGVFAVEDGEAKRAVSDLRQQERASEAVRTRQVAEKEAAGRAGALGSAFVFGHASASSSGRRSGEDRPGSEVADAGPIIWDAGAPAQARRPSDGAWLNCTVLRPTTPRQKGEPPASYLVLFKGAQTNGRACLIKFLLLFYTLLIKWAPSVLMF